MKWGVPGIGWGISLSCVLKLPAGDGSLNLCLLAEFFSCCILSHLASSWNGSPHRLWCLICWRSHVQMHFLNLDNRQWSLLIWGTIRLGEWISEVFWCANGGVLVSVGSFSRYCRGCVIGLAVVPLNLFVGLGLWNSCVNTMGKCWSESHSGWCCAMSSWFISTMVCVTDTLNG